MSCLLAFFTVNKELSSSIYLYLCMYLYLYLPYKLAAARDPHLGSLPKGVPLTTA